MAFYASQLSQSVMQTRFLSLVAVSKRAGNWILIRDTFLRNLSRRELLVVCSLSPKSRL